MMGPIRDPRGRRRLNKAVARKRGGPYAAEINGYEKLWRFVGGFSAVAMHKGRRREVDASVKPRSDRQRPSTVVTAGCTSYLAETNLLRR